MKHFCLESKLIFSKLQVRTVLNDNYFMYLVAATSMMEVRCRVLFYSDYYSMYMVPPHL